MIERNGDVLIGDSWEELGINIPMSRENSSMDLKIKGCPECKDQGKRNGFDLSVIPAEGKGKCHKCGTKFVIRRETEWKRKGMPEKEFTPPNRKNLTPLSDEGLKHFTDRRISQEAVKAFKIVEQMMLEDGSNHRYVAFPYFYNGELVNIKYKRDYKEGTERKKKFKQSPNGKHVMFNYDEAKRHIDKAPKGDKKVIICEGEEECLCWYDAGFPYAVSVDSGAPNPKDVIDKKLECFTNSFDLFESAEIIYIATDNDDNGRRLAEEIQRRLDTDKVRLVSFGAHKDANDVVMLEGRARLKMLLSEAKEVRMEGVIYLNDVRDKMWDMYNNGLPKGTTTYYPTIDTRWKWRVGEVNVCTGYNNEGKSTLFVINLPLLKSLYEGWKWACFVPENFPEEEFFEEIIHCLLGKTTDVDFASIRATPEEYEAAMNFVQEHFIPVNPEKHATLEELFKRFDYLVRKHGIRGIILDPYNQIEHKYMKNETIDQYVSRFMSLLKKFTVSRKLHAILVAHQNPPKERDQYGNLPKPNLYHIKNGGTFGDKADNVLYAFRPVRFSDPTNPFVEFGSDKLKKKKLVMAECGSCEIQYDWRSHRYIDPALNGTPFDFRRVQTARVELEEDEMPF